MYDVTLAQELAAVAGRQGVIFLAAEIVCWLWVPRNVLTLTLALAALGLHSVDRASQYAAQTLRICCSILQIQCARPANILHRPCKDSAHNRPYEYAGTLSYDLPHHYNQLS